MSAWHKQPGPTPYIPPTYVRMLADGKHSITILPSAWGGKWMTRLNDRVTGPLKDIGRQCVRLETALRYADAYAHNNGGWAPHKEEVGEVAE